MTTNPSLIMGSKMSIVLRHSVYAQKITPQGQRKGHRSWLCPARSSSPTLGVEREHVSSLLISMRLAKPTARGTCLGDLPRLGVLDDHCLLSWARTSACAGEESTGSTTRDTLSWQLQSATAQVQPLQPGIPFWPGFWVSSGEPPGPIPLLPTESLFVDRGARPHVGPFFLDPTSSSSLAKLLQPQVCFPSKGITAKPGKEKQLLSGGPLPLLEPAPITFSQGLQGDPALLSPQGIG